MVKIVIQAAAAAKGMDLEARSSSSNVGACMWSGWKWGHKVTERKRNQGPLFHPIAFWEAGRGEGTVLGVPRGGLVQIFPLKFEGQGPNRVLNECNVGHGVEFFRFHTPFIPTAAAA